MILIFIIEERDRVIKVLRDSLYGGAFMSGKLAPQTNPSKNRHYKRASSSRLTLKNFDYPEYLDTV